MKLVKLSFLFLFFLSSMSSSAQGIFVTHKEASGGNTGENGCSSCLTLSYIFYTTNPLSYNTTKGLQVNAEVNQGTAEVTQVIESVALPQVGEDCQIYSHTFEVQICCLCEDENDACPSELSISLTTWGECLFDNLGSAYFDIDCFNSEGFTEYADVIEEGIDMCETIFTYSSLCCGEGYPDSGAQGRPSNDNFEIGQVDSDAQFSISPNPARSILNLNGVNVNDQISISDVSGKLIKLVNVNSDEELVINIENLEDGLYIIQKVDKYGNVQVLKFLKI